jgi:hypothetical protein
MPGARSARRRMCSGGSGWSAHALVRSRRNHPAGAALATKWLRRRGFLHWRAKVLSVNTDSYCKGRMRTARDKCGQVWLCQLEAHVANVAHSCNARLAAH